MDAWPRFLLLPSVCDHERFHPLSPFLTPFNAIFCITHFAMGIDAIGARLSALAGAVRRKNLDHIQHRQITPAAPHGRAVLPHEAVLAVERHRVQRRLQ